jgi:hypothetical protein
VVNPHPVGRNHGHGWRRLLCSGELIVYRGLTFRGPYSPSLLGGEPFLYINGFRSGFFVPLLPVGAAAVVAALHALQRERYGMPGALVAWISFVSLVLVVGALAAGVNFASISDCGCLTVLGWGLLVATVSVPVLGVLTITAGRLPRRCDIALIFGSPLLCILVAPLGGVAWALVGFAIFRARAHQAKQRSRVH